MRPTPIPDSGSRTMPAASHARMRRTAVGGRGRLPRGAVAVCAALAAAVVLALLATAFPAVLGDAAPAIIDDAIDAADRVPAVRDPAAAAGALEPRQLGVKMTGRRSTTRRRKTTSRRRRSTTKKRRATSKRRSTSKRATSKRVTAKVLATTRPPVRTTTLPAIRTTRPVVVRTTVSPIPRVTPLPPTPFNLSVVADDRAAVLIFDNSTGGERNYRIVWGPANGSANVTAYWPHSNFQVQPLTPGVQYFATVQSVGTSRTLFGNLSLPAGPVFFSSNPARVDAIRAQATGFFDDFNTGPGDLDAGKWQTSYSRCADPAASATFINAQFHAHNLVKDLGFARGWCEGSHVAARPRGMFDFTGRTGKVFFDFDGPVSSNYWFLDFQKDEYFDNEAQMRQTMGYSVPSGNVTRYFLHMRQNLLIFQPYGDSSVNYTANLCTVPSDLCRTINVRRRFVVSISRTAISVTANERTVLEASGFDLPFERARLAFRQNGSRNPRHNTPFTTVHWDNFGFDGPAPDSVTRNFRAWEQLDASWKQLSSFGGVATVQVAGALPPGQVRGGRFMYRFQPDNGTLAWSKNDTILVDGTAVLPVFNGSFWRAGRDFTNVYPDAMNRSAPANHFVLYLDAALAASLAAPGNHTFRFSFANDGFLTGAHLELDFARTGTPADNAELRAPTWFPALPPSFHPRATTTSAGPLAKITAVGNFSTEVPCERANPLDLTSECVPVDSTHPLFPKLLLRPGPQVPRGMQEVRYRLRPGNAVTALGSAVPLARFELTLDGTVVHEVMFPGNIVTYGGSFALDTAQLAPGAHELVAMAWDVKGNVAWQDYVEFSEAGRAYPLYFTVA